MIGPPETRAGAALRPECVVRFTEVMRSNRLESWHAGAAVVTDADGAVLREAGDTSLRTYLRSAAKPVQLLTMLEAGLERDLGLSTEELAICAASHGGEAGHVLCVRGLLARTGIAESQLRCGAHPPLDPAAAADLARRGEEPLPVHNNCSGKHAAMLATCRANGWDEEGYLGVEHPLQRRIAARVAELSGAASEIGVDGCGVPTFFLSLRAAATMTARLMALAGPGSDAGRVVGAMTAAPWYTSASRRGAYRLMAALPGLLAKEGAEGFFVVGLDSGRSPWGRPVGLAFKVADGAGEEARGRDVAVASALLSLGVARGDERAALAALTTRPVLSVAGRDVGEVRGVLAL